MKDTHKGITDQNIRDICARSLCRSLGNGPGTVRDAADDVCRVLDSARLIDLARAISRDLEGIRYLNASGVELSDVGLSDVPVPVGTIRTDETVWPDAIAGEIRARSRQIQPGAYRVDIVSS
jgi:hypothetical protein